METQQLKVLLNGMIIYSGSEKDTEKFLKTIHNIREQEIKNITGIKVLYKKIGIQISGIKILKPQKI